MASPVTAPNGLVWNVRRRVTPRLGDESAWGRFRSRYRKVVKRTSNLPDVDLGWLEIFGEGIAFGIGIILAIVLLAFVVIPLLVAILDVLVVLLLGAVGVALRIALRRPWTVEATSSDGDVLRWRIVGWRASGEKVTAIASELASGGRPEPDWYAKRQPVVNEAQLVAPRASSSRPPLSVVIAWIVVALVGIAIAVTIRTVVVDSKPSYDPPCERAGTGC